MQDRFTLIAVMRILFMGTPDFSVPTLEALIESEHEVVAVVSQPDRPKGRGKQLQPTPVKEVALAHEIPVYQPNRVREEGFMESMEALDLDLAVVVAFGQILPKAMLSIPKHGCMNIHASLLPKYRGAGPIQWSVINGDQVSGVTTMYMDVGMDTGDMLLKEEVVLDPKETGGSLFGKLSTIGGPLILKTIEQLENGTLVRVKQNDDDATHAPMLEKKQGNVDWKSNAVDIERLIRGLNPWPSAYTYLDGKMLKLWEADVVTIDEGDEEPGAVLKADGDGMLVKCGTAGLQITSLQLQGKKRMSAADFLRGYNIETGIILSQIPK